MRVRNIVSGEKTIVTETKWSTKDMPPKHAPVYSKTKPIRAGWQWKSAKIKGQNSAEYILVAECNPERNNWRWLIPLTQVALDIVCRVI